MGAAEPVSACASVEVTEMDDEERVILHERVTPLPGSCRLTKCTPEESREKKQIHKRLLEYREKHGLGAYDALARRSGGKLTPDMIRDMAIGERFSMECWRALGRALPKRQRKKHE